MKYPPGAVIFLIATILLKGVVQSAPNVAPEVDNATAAAPKQTFQEAEKEITDFINSLLRSLLPQIVGGSGGAKLSPRCTGAMMKVFGNIRRMKGWTVKMLDSLGKPSAGILQGGAYSLGAYDPCLRLKVTSKGQETDRLEEAAFTGQYCRFRIRFPEAVVERALDYQHGRVNATELGKLRDIVEVIPYLPMKSNYMSHFLGLCFPSTCTMDDMQQFAKLVPFPGSTTVDRCEVKSEAEPDSTQVVILCLLLVLAMLAAISSFIHWLLHSGHEEKSYQKSDKKCLNVTLAFSFCNNTARLTRNIEDDTEGLLAGHSVRGVLVASVAWFVLGHTYLYPSEGYYLQISSLANLKEYWDKEYFSVIVSFPLAADALIVCVGFILTYSLWQPVLKTKDVCVNIISLILKYYIRLCLPLLFFFGCLLLLPLAGSGPFWGDLVQDPVDRCGNRMAPHFAMYANFLDTEEQCFPHLWLVSCLAQLTLMGIILSWVLSKNIKVGVGIMLILVIVCNASVGMLTLKHEFPPTYVAYFVENSSSLFRQVSLSLPLSHFGSYVAGMLAGILVARRDSHRTRKFFGVVGWLACLGVLYCILHLTHRSRDGSFTASWSAVFAALHRTAFGLCVAWVLVACSFGIGGFVNAILSWRVLDPLARLIPYAYVFHVLVIAYVSGTARERTAYGHAELVLRAFSYLGASFAIAYLLSLLLELPLASLRSALMPRKEARLDVTPLNNFFSKGEDHVIRKNGTIEGNCKLWSITETHNGVAY